MRGKKINLIHYNKGKVEIQEIDGRGDVVERKDLFIYKFLMVDKLRRGIAVCFGQVEEELAMRGVREEEGNQVDRFEYYQVDEGAWRKLEGIVSKFENGGVLRARDFCNRNRVECAEYEFLFPLMVFFEDGNFEQLLGVGCDYLEEDGSLVVVLLEASFFEDGLEVGMFVSCKCVEIEGERRLVVDKIIK